MTFIILAAAGLAEAAWAMAAIQMWAGLVVIGLVAVGSMAFRSRLLVFGSVVLYLLFNMFFEPWHCFKPFPPEAYSDPDVAGAAEMFGNVGTAWLLVSGLVAVCVVIDAVRLFLRCQPSVNEISAEEAGESSTGGACELPPFGGFYNRQ